MIDVFLYFLIKFICILFDGNFSELSILKIEFKKVDITVLASTTVDLYFLHNFHLDSSEVV